jgi:hypothetical protein
VAQSPAAVATIAAPAALQQQQHALANGHAAAVTAGAGAGQSASQQLQQQQQLSGQPVGATTQKPILPQVSAHFNITERLWASGCLMQVECLQQCSTAYATSSAASCCCAAWYSNVSKLRTTQNLFAARLSHLVAIACGLRGRPSGLQLVKATAESSVNSSYLL